MLLIWIFILYPLCSLKTSGLFFFLVAWRSFSSHPKALFSFELNFVLPKPSPVGFTQHSSLREPLHKANLERKKTNSNIWVCVGVNNSITYSFFFFVGYFWVLLDYTKYEDSVFSEVFNVIIFK